MELVARAKSCWKIHPSAVHRPTRLEKQITPYLYHVQIHTFHANEAVEYCLTAQLSIA